MSYEVMVGNKATAVGCKLARVKVAAAFPITPQTTITEYLSEIYASGELPGFEFINVEGELSSQVIVQAAEAVGARSFTCTSGPGLLYMHHPMQETASKRLPLVMAVVHRSIKSMQPDHQRPHVAAVAGLAPHLRGERPGDPRHHGDGVQDR